MSEQIKFLDANGVKILWDKISMQDYPNNATLMAVINAIDATKADKDELPQPLIGTVDTITPNHVLSTMLKGESIAVTYTDEVLGVCTFNHFTYNSMLNNILAFFNLSQQSNTYYVELSGLLDTDTWTLTLKRFFTVDDIDSTLTKNGCPADSMAVGQALSKTTQVQIITWEDDD